MSEPVTPLTPAQEAKAASQERKEGYVHHVLIAFDQFVNVIAGGHPDETISARAGRAAEQGKVWGKVMSRFLDVFQKNHGAKAVAGDATRAVDVDGLEQLSGLIPDAVPPEESK